MGPYDGVLFTHEKELGHERTPVARRKEPVQEGHGLRESLKHTRLWTEPVGRPVVASSVGAQRDGQAGPGAPPGQRRGSERHRDGGCVPLCICQHPQKAQHREGTLMWQLGLLLVIMRHHWLIDCDKCSTRC